MLYYETTPFPYHNCRTDLLEPTGTVDAFCETYSTSLGTFDSSTDQDWRKLELIFAGIHAINAKTRAEPWNGQFGQPARAEFFWHHDERAAPHPHDSRRGMVLYDNRGTPLLHAIHALLGYDGSGPGLSHDVLKAIGVPDELFHQANQDVAHQSYSVIFSRESHEHVEGVDTAIPFSEVGEWTYWRIR